MKSRYGPMAMLMMARLFGASLQEAFPWVRNQHIGPDPHVYTEEEGKEIARQIAAQRKAKKRYRKAHTGG